jgi:hypothetical protein
MPHGDKDFRVGSGQRLAGQIRTQTNKIPSDCKCEWTVETPGPGLACISVIRYLNNLCGLMRQHEEDAAAQTGEVARAS